MCKWVKKDVHGLFRLEPDLNEHLHLDMSGEIFSGNLATFTLSEALRYAVLSLKLNGGILEKFRTVSVFKFLHHLEMDDMEINDFQDLALLNSLSVLSLSNSVLNKTAWEDLPKAHSLTYLDLEGMEVEEDDEPIAVDLEVLTQLEYLCHVDLQGLKLKNLASLKKCRYLRVINLIGAEYNFSELEELMVDSVLEEVTISSHTIQDSDDAEIYERTLNVVPPWEE